MRGTRTAWGGGWEARRVRTGAERAGEPDARGAARRRRPDVAEEPPAGSGEVLRDEEDEAEGEVAVEPLVLEADLVMGPG